MFVTAAATTSAGLYLFFGLREPRMAAQMLALRAPNWDVLGCLVLLLHVVSEPVALLALAAIPAVLVRRGQRWTLLLLFLLTSLILAALVGVQAG